MNEQKMMLRARMSELQIYLKSLQKARKYLRPLDDSPPSEEATVSNVWSTVMSKFKKGEADKADFELLYTVYGDHVADMVMDEWYQTQVLLEHLRMLK